VEFEANGDSTHHRVELNRYDNANNYRVELEPNGDKAHYRLELKSDDEESDNRVELDRWRCNRLIAAAGSGWVVGRLRGRLS
jgi:hypothetical protein